MKGCFSDTCGKAEILADLLDVGRVEREGARRRYLAAQDCAAFSHAFHQFVEQLVVHGYSISMRATPLCFKLPVLHQPHQQH